MAAKSKRKRHVQQSLFRRGGKVFADRYHVEVITTPKELEGEAWMWPIRETYDPRRVRRPQRGLLREGWKRGGGALGARDVPGEQRTTSSSLE